jgi:hypothetical protein
MFDTRLKYRLKQKDQAVDPRVKPRQIGVDASLPHTLKSRMRRRRAGEVMAVDLAGEKTLGKLLYEVAGGMSRGSIKKANCFS